MSYSAKMELSKEIEYARESVAYGQARLVEMRRKHLPDSLIQWYARSVWRRQYRLARLLKRTSSN